jgi:hypothetical protein
LSTKIAAMKTPMAMSAAMSSPESLFVVGV